MFLCVCVCVYIISSFHLLELWTDDGFSPTGTFRGVCKKIDHFPEDADYEADAAEYLLRKSSASHCACTRTLTIFAKAASLKSARSCSWRRKGSAPFLVPQSTLDTGEMGTKIGGGGWEGVLSILLALLNTEHLPQRQPIGTQASGLASQ